MHNHDSCWASRSQLTACKFDAAFSLSFSKHCCFSVLKSEGDNEVRWCTHLCHVVLSFCHGHWTQPLLPAWVRCSWCDREITCSTTPLMLRQGQQGCATEAASQHYCAADATSRAGLCHRCYVTALLDRWCYVKGSIAPPMLRHSTTTPLMLRQWQGCATDVTSWQYYATDGTSCSDAGNMAVLSFYFWRWKQSSADIVFNRNWFLSTM